MENIQPQEIVKQSAVSDTALQDTLPSPVPQSETQRSASLTQSQKPKRKRGVLHRSAGLYPKNNKGLTLKQSSFIGKVIETRNPTQAAREVYDVKTDNDARSIAAANMKKPAIRSVIDAALNSAGITMDKLAAVSIEALNTKKPDVIKWSDVHSFVRTSAQLLGALHDDSRTQVNIGIKVD